MKIKFVPTLSTLGFVLGTGIVYLILYFVNVFRDNNGVAKVDDYINNCIKVKLVVRKPSSLEIDDMLGNIKKNANVYFISTVSFYDSAAEKYFKLEFIGGNQAQAGADDLFGNIHNGDKIEATVNQTELSDTAYGTQKKPVPIFKFEYITQGVDTTSYPYCLNATPKDDSVGTNANTEKMYRDMIGIYLTFVKSRKDFKKMFPK